MNNMFSTNQNNTIDQQLLTSVSSVAACRFCLILGVKMYKLAGNKQLQCYEEALAYQFDPEDLRLSVCYECSHLLMKLYNFKIRCLRAHNILCNLKSSCGQITENELRKLDRSSANLESPVSFCNSFDTVALYTVKYEDCENVIKIEYENLPEGAVFGDQDYTNAANSYIDGSTYVKNEMSTELNDAKSYISLGTVLKTLIVDFDCGTIQNVDVSCNKALKKSDTQNEKRKMLRKRKEIFDLGQSDAAIESKNDFQLSDNDHWSDDSDNVALTDYKNVKLKLKAEPKSHRSRKRKCKKSNKSDNEDLISGLYRYKINDDDWEIVTLTKEEQIAKFNNPEAMKTYKRMQFPCDICHRGFFTKKSFDKHNLRHVKSFGPNECWLCKTRYKYKPLLDAHLQRHGRIYSCRRCDYTTDLMYSVKGHDKAHQNKVHSYCPIQCELCDSKFSTKAAFEMHMQSCHTSALDFLCESCGDNLHTAPLLDEHMLEDQCGTALDVSAADAKELFCAECDLQFKSADAFGKHLRTANVHNRDLSADTKFTAKPKLFTKTRTTELDESRWTVRVLNDREQEEEYQARLAANIRQKHPFECAVCKKRFKKQSLLDSHTLLHTREGRFECKLCQYRFKIEGYLRGHYKTRHLYKYECKRCSFVTVCRTHASKHESYHNGVRFTCTTCNLKFAKETSLRTHLRIKHRSDIVCEMCGDNFLSDMGLDMHKKLAHAAELRPRSGEEASYCAVCDIRFASQAAYDVHLTTSLRHGDLPAGDTRKSGLRARSNFKGKIPENVKETLKLRDQPGNPKRRLRSAGFSVHCDECNKDIPDYMYVKHCKREHPGAEIKKTFICEQCGFMASSNVLLVSHREKHSMAKQPCPECGKKFASKRSLWTHMLIHKGLRRHCCPDCGKTFVQGGDMKMHYKRIHLRLPMPKRVRTKRLDHGLLYIANPNDEF